MAPKTTLLLVAALAAAALAHPEPAAAAGDGSLRMEILVDGVPCPEYRHGGATYVEALRGREYSVRLTNLEPVRVAVALAVDGRNSIDAKRTSVAAARKWILEPGQSVVIDGWQTSTDIARRFFFTDERSSYAAWLGDLSNAGVIEAVSFRERARVPVAIYDEPHGSSGDSREARAREPSSPRVLPPASRAGADAEAAAPADSMAGQARAEKSAPALGMRRDEDDNAATGIGRETLHEVVRVAFDAEPHPAGRARVRYEFRSALVEMGVLPRPVDRSPLARRERASGFTDGPWCPVPPAR